MKLKQRNLKGIAIALTVVLMLGFAFVKEYGDAFNITVKMPGNVSMTLERNPADEQAYAAVGPANVADVVERVSPAIVNIETSTRVSGSSNPFFNDPFFRDFFGDQLPATPQEETGIGTGFIISDNGLIMTNNHVVAGADEIRVKIIGYSKPLVATVIGADEQLDLAVIKVNSSKKLPTLRLGNSDAARVGDWVIAIGNPYGLDHTVTVGVIGAKERPITVDGRRYTNFIQTDAAINPGNSGGPLLTTSGEVIAINTAVNASAQGIGFAIPINTAKEVKDQLISKGKITRAYLGVYLRDLTEEAAQYLQLNSTNGALVAEIINNSPASKAGLVKGDVILAINGKNITGSSDVTRIIGNMKPDQKVTLKVYREHAAVSIVVQLEEKP
ncbi:MAG: trypsin-like peptidase domain-containing protein [Solirubrobacterales bacterium]